MSSQLGKPKFKTGNYICCTINGLDVMQIIHISECLYKLKQINNSNSGRIGLIFYLYCETIDGIYSIVTNEMKAELL